MMYIHIKRHLTLCFEIQPQGHGFYYRVGCTTTKERYMFVIQILAEFTSIGPKGEKNVSY